MLNIKFKNIIKIRIIGGKWRGRKLLFTPCNNLKITGNRIKEDLFNWLSPIIKKTQCLDCFAGSGSLGFEAISRYANNVILLEINYYISIQIRKNIKMLNSNQIEVINIDSFIWLKNNFKQKKFDIVFIDPPFYKNMVNKTILLLKKNCIFNNNARIYIESELNSPVLLIPDNWLLYKKKISGNVIYYLYIYQNM